MFEQLDSSVEHENTVASVKSLKELIDLVSGRNLRVETPQEDSGIAEILPFPFLGLVGQYEMKLALLLAVINPHIGGVLLIGPRGTGKTTAVRSLLDLLPEVQRSLCFYGCLPEDIESGGIDAVCPDCAKKYAEGSPLTKSDQVRFVELPLNAGLSDIIGRLDDQSDVHDRYRLKPGILSQADLNILYIDEVNLLANDHIDVILDAASHGLYTIRRGALSATFKSRLTLIGSMNPEEGSLRSQIMDRFGLRVLVQGLANPADRILAYERVSAYRMNPHRLIDQFKPETETLKQEIIEARKLLRSIQVDEKITELGTNLIKELKIDTLRAEITLFEAARAHAAANFRSSVTTEDIRATAPMALRLRNTPFIVQYFADRSAEENQVTSIMDRLIP